MFLLLCPRIHSHLLPQCGAIYPLTTLGTDTHSTYDPKRLSHASCPAWEQKHPVSHKVTFLSLRHACLCHIHKLTHEHRGTPHVSHSKFTPNPILKTVIHPESHCGTLIPKETYPGVLSGFLLYTRQCARRLLVCPGSSHSLHPPPCLPDANLSSLCHLP